MKQNIKQSAILFFLANVLVLGCSKIVSIHDPVSNTWYDCDLLRSDYPEGHPCRRHALAYQEEQRKSTSRVQTSGGFQDRAGPDHSFRDSKEKGSGGKSKDRGLGLYDR
ncbi:MAG: hypothetical protein ACOYUZ_01845 [Patescibacteria group bacterium]